MYMWTTTFFDEFLLYITISDINLIDLPSLKCKSGNIWGLSS